MLIPAPLFGDHAVLCRGKEIRIFGTCSGDTVHAMLTDRENRLLGENTAEADGGHFLVHLPPQSAQTGCTLSITCGSETYSAADIAIGEVYLAGGQSNMELELKDADGGLECIEAHNDPDLRYFNVPKRAVWDAEAVQAERDSHWERIAPGTGRDMSAVAYFFARKLREHLDVPVGVIDCYWGGTSVTAWMDEEALRRTAEGQRYLDDYAAQAGSKTLAQWQAEEDAFQAELAEWNSRVAAVREAEPDADWTRINQAAGLCPWHPPVGCGSPYRPGGLTETMLKRVAPATLTGMLYYQGEDDAPRTTRYDQLLESMVIRWRELFMEDDLPFLNVQLPMWIEAGAEETYLWPAIRRAQERAWKHLNRTGLAVLIDCGEYGNIHPTDKRTVGERLFEQARRVVYGEDGAESPRALGKWTCGHRLMVRLSAPVHAIGTPGLAEVAGADGVYHPAHIEIVGDTLCLTSPEVPCPIAARYAWISWGKVCLFGRNGLPLAPFVVE